MPVIDEQGRLFGVVNVVDALVVLVVLAVVAAGVALVAAPEDSDREPRRFATVSYDVPLDSDAATLAVGDQLLSVRGDESYEVAAVHHSVAPDGTAHVVATVPYRGSLTFGGSTVYGGQAVSVRTSDYRTKASVETLGGTDGTIATDTRSVVLRTNGSVPLAGSVSAGDAVSVGQSEVGTVRAVATRRQPEELNRTLVGLELTARTTDSVARFGGHGLRAGAPLTVVTDTAVVRGRIAAVDTTDPSAVDQG